jgi:hypothetical protein
MTTAYELAQLALETRGYLVIADNEIFEVGTVIDWKHSTIRYGRFRSQLKVVAKTTPEDMADQCRLFGLLADPDTSYNYYRVVAE